MDDRQTDRQSYIFFDILLGQGSIWHERERAILPRVHVLLLGGASFNPSLIFCVLRILEAAQFLKLL